MLPLNRAFCFPGFVFAFPPNPHLSLEAMEDEADFSDEYAAAEEEMSDVEEDGGSEIDPENDDVLPDATSFQRSSLRRENSRQCQNFR